MTIEHRKINIIRQIAASTHEEFIDAIDEVVRKFSRPKFSLDLSSHANFKEKVDLGKILSERTLIDFEMTDFIKEADELEWEKSVEELLEELD